MEYKKIKEINEYKSESINPMKTPDTMYELYSVPFFTTGHPEYLHGSEIGSSKVTVQKNDILVCKINPRINRVWVVADESNYQSIASSEWIVVRTAQHNPYFLAWYFRTPMFQQLMTSEVTGIGGSLTRAQPKRVAEYPVPVLSREKQDKIVSILDRLESIKRERKSELDLLDSLVKARFVEMFGHMSVDTTVSDVCSIITDGTHQPPKFKNEGIPFLFVSNIADNKLTYDTEKFIDEATYNELIKRTPIEVGDVLLSTVGSYGHPAVVENKKRFLFQRHIAYLKPNHKKVGSYYLYASLLSDSVQYQIDTHVKGIAQKTLNLKEIKNLKIPLPSLDEQKMFTVFFREVNKSKSVIQKSLDEMQILFQSLMQKYFG